MQGWGRSHGVKGTQVQLASCLRVRSGGWGGGEGGDRSQPWDSGFRHRVTMRQDTLCWGRDVGSILRSDMDMESPRCL